MKFQFITGSAGGLLKLGFGSFDPTDETDAQRRGTG